MKKAAIKVSYVIFQDMLKLPFGVAIEEVIYDKEAQEFTVIIFGEQLDDSAEVKDNKIRVADYEVLPVWHKGKITLTDKIIEWPKESSSSPKQKTNKPPKEDKEEVGEVEEDEKETEQPESSKQPSRKSTRKRKS